MTWKNFSNFIYYILFYQYKYIRYGGERYEKRDIQQRVRKQFKVLQDQEHETIPWSMIDADQSIDDVSANIWDIVQPITQSSMYKPIAKIWQDGCFEL